MLKNIREYQLAKIRLIERKNVNISGGRFVGSNELHSAVARSEEPPLLLLFLLFGLISV